MIDEDNKEDTLIEDKYNDTPEEEDVAQTPTKPGEEEVTLYFANTEYIETGDESLEQLIPEKKGLLNTRTYPLKRLL